MNQLRGGTVNVQLQNRGKRAFSELPFGECLFCYLVGVVVKKPCDL